MTGWDIVEQGETLLQPERAV